MAAIDSNFRMEETEHGAKPGASTLEETDVCIQLVVLYYGLRTCMVLYLVRYTACSRVL